MTVRFIEQKKVSQDGALQNTTWLCQGNEWKNRRLVSIKFQTPELLLCGSFVHLLVFLFSKGTGVFQAVLHARGRESIFEKGDILEST